MTATARRERPPRYGLPQKNLPRDTPGTLSQSTPRMSEGVVRDPSGRFRTSAKMVSVKSGSNNKRHDRANRYFLHHVQLFQSLAAEKFLCLILLETEDTAHSTARDNRGGRPRASLLLKSHMPHDPVSVKQSDDYSDRPHADFHSPYSKFGNQHTVRAGWESFVLFHTTSQG